MRFRPGLVWISAVALFCFVLHGIAADPDAPQPHRVGALSFLVPASWRTQIAPESAPAGVVFSAEGEGARLTVARTPSSAMPAAPLSTRMDPMVAPELTDFRTALGEAGLTPVSGAVEVTGEGAVSVETVAFRCKSLQGKDVVVLTATWRNGPQTLRARLQYSEGLPPKAGALLTGIRGSLRFQGAPTSGFGKFQNAGQPPQGWPVAIGSAPPPSAPATPAVVSNVPAPAVTSEPPAISAGDLGRMVQDYRGSLVFIEGGGGAGSGFVCQTRDGVFLLTNQHVMAGMAAPRFTRLDQSPIVAGAGAAAVGHDLMRFALQAEVKPLAAMPNVESEATIGDDIVVLGNSEGARVIQPLAGKLVGIGPDRVEVSAEFVPGNSGSPIIHVKTGKVIGIATYLIQRRFTELTDSKESKVRRFGFRLDSVKQWQPLNWQAFQQDKATMDRVESTTQDLFRLIKELKGQQQAGAAAYTNSSIARAVRDLDAVFANKGKGVSAADRTRAYQNFFSAVRVATQTDVLQARQALRYDYFLRALGDENQVRDDMYKLFDRIVKAR